MRSALCGFIMMRKLKFAILVSMVLIGGIVLVSLWVNLQGRKASEEDKAPPAFSADDAKMFLEKIHFVEDKQGRKTWELEAKSIQQNREENLLFLEDVKVTVYAEEGRSFVITGKQGKVFMDSKNMELLGDVMVTSSDGYRLRTQSVAYRHQEKNLGTSDPVEIEGEQMRVIGKGMQIDMEARTFKIFGQVKTQLRLGGKA
jgi:LPS export ABC transporter protein LptC